MKKLIILLILIISIFLTSCTTLHVLNPSQITMPDDIEFINLVKQLDTPEKICQYMQENFTPLEINSVCYIPYEMYQYKTGDCSDYADFSAFVANYHGYEVYRMLIVFEDAAHMITILKIDSKFNYIDWHDYFEVGTDNISDVLNNWSGVKGYRIFDYNMNIIEHTKNTS